MIQIILTAISICGLSFAVVAQNGQPTEWQKVEMIEKSCLTFAVAVPSRDKVYSLEDLVVVRQAAETGEGYASTFGGIGYQATFEAPVDKAVFDDYQKEFADFKQSSIVRNSISGTRFSAPNEAHEFFLVGEILYHVWTIGANELNPAAQKFFDSLEFNPKMNVLGTCSAATPEIRRGMGSSDGRIILAKVSGTGARIAAEKPVAPAKTEDGTTPLKILSKPQPGYTDEARAQNIGGIIRLKIVFKSDGSIGDIAVISGLPHGLTERTIAAARRITFVPASKNGAPITVTKTVEYAFFVY